MVRPRWPPLTLGEAAWRVREAAEETDRSKDRHRASDRLHNAHRPHRSLQQHSTAGATDPLSGAPIHRCDETDSAASYRSTCRSHDATGSRHPQVHASLAVKTPAPSVQM